MRDPHDPWQDELTAATPTPQLTPTETELRRRAINDCPHCDQDGYRGTTVCNHRTENPAEAAARGAAAIRHQMGWNTPAGTTTPDNTQKPAHDHPGPQE